MQSVVDRNGNVVNSGTKLASTDDPTTAMVEVVAINRPNPSEYFEPNIRLRWLECPSGMQPEFGLPLSIFRVSGWVVCKPAWC